MPRRGTEPDYMRMTDEDIERAIDEIKNALQEATIRSEEMSARK